jgi:DNA-directed RNA polymerase subunit RPC12/RpoP
MTTLIALSCNHCGAPLDLPSSTRFATCAHCGSRLVVSETGGAWVTVVLDELTAKTDRLGGALRELQLRDELERLDAEWAARLANDDFPAIPVDAERSGRMQGGLAILCGFVGLAFAMVVGPSYGSLVICILGGTALFLLLSNLHFRSRDREVAERTYLARRVTIVRELRASELEANSPPLFVAPPQL